MQKNLKYKNIESESVFSKKSWCFLQAQSIWYKFTDFIRFILGSCMIHWVSLWKSGNNSQKEQILKEESMASLTAFKFVIVYLGILFFICCKKNIEDGTSYNDLLEEYKSRVHSKMDASNNDNDKSENNELVDNYYPEMPNRSLEKKSCQERDESLNNKDKIISNDRQEEFYMKGDIDIKNELNIDEITSTENNIIDIDDNKMENQVSDNMKSEEESIDDEHDIDIEKERIIEEESSHQASDLKSDIDVIRKSQKNSNIVTNRKSLTSEKRKVENEIIKKMAAYFEYAWDKNHTDNLRYTLKNVLKFAQDGAIRYLDPNFERYKNEFVTTEINGKQTQEKKSKIIYQIKSNLTKSLKILSKVINKLDLTYTEEEFDLHKKNSFLLEQILDCINGISKCYNLAKTINWEYELLETVISFSEGAYQASKNASQLFDDIANDREINFGSEVMFNYALCIETAYTRISQINDRAKDIYEKITRMTNSKKKKKVFEFKFDEVSRRMKLIEEGLAYSEMEFQVAKYLITGVVRSYHVNQKNKWKVLIEFNKILRIHSNTKDIYEKLMRNNTNFDKRISVMNFFTKLKQVTTPTAN